MPAVLFLATFLAALAISPGIALLLTWGVSSILGTPFWSTFIFVFAFTWLIGALRRRG